MIDMFHLQMLYALLALLLWLFLRGKDIRAIRKKLGLTQEEFSFVMEVDYRTIQRWEKDELKPRPHRHLQLTALSELLDGISKITPEAIRTWEGLVDAALLKRLEMVFGKGVYRNHNGN